MATVGAVTRRDRVLVWAVPVVMLLVAGIAIVRYHRVQQSSWQGIGFGMFATYEYSPARTVRVEASMGGEPTVVTVPPDLRSLRERVLVAPGSEWAEELARELRHRSDAERLVLEVWGNHVEIVDEGLRISFKVLQRIEVTAP